MSNPTVRRASLFACAAILLGVFGLMVVYFAGFGQMAATADLRPERLRDYTFPVWHMYPLTKHGFLTFLQADDFAKGHAYANESTIYLWLMWVLYRVESIFPSVTMRVVSAFVSMSATLIAIGSVIPKSTWVKVDFRHGVLLLTAFGYFLTLPTFWISLGKFNVDNVFVLVFPVLLFASAFIARGGPHGKRFWLTALLMCALMPMTAALYGTFVGVRAVFSRRPNLPMLRSALVMTLVAVGFYLQPVIVAKLLHFTSENSTWLFRSGLDGDMRFYGNFINSILVPQFDRPMYFILMPIALLGFQLWYRNKFYLELNFHRERDNSFAIMPYLFSSYFFTLLLWPQAVSIHPYLYDAFLVGPIGTWVVLNFATPEVHERHFLAWWIVLLFLITFNITKIAQAGHCPLCYYPPWGMQGPQAG